MIIKIIGYKNSHLEPPFLNHLGMVLKKENKRIWYRAYSVLNNKTHDVFYVVEGEYEIVGLL